MTEDLGEKQILQEGWLLRESTYLSHVVNRRYAILRQNELVTLRRKDDPSTSKSWRLSGTSRVDPPGKKTFNKVKGGTEKSLWAAISLQSTETSLHYVTVHTAQGVATLAFEDQLECNSWFTAVAGALEELRVARAARPHHSDGSGTSSIAHTPRKALHGLGAAGAAAMHGIHVPGRSHKRSGSRGASLSRGSSPPRSEMGTSRSRRDYLERMHTEDTSMESSRSLSHHSLTPEVLERRKQARQKWKPYTYVNGVSVYLENRARHSEHDDPSFMTCHVIRAPPELCKDEALSKGLGEDIVDEAAPTEPEEEVVESNTETLYVADTSGGGSRVLERPDHDTAVLCETWPAPMWLRPFIARREMVLRRTWRQEEDGTFVVVYSSTTHHKSRPRETAWWQWLAPIRAQVEAGVTFAPLMQRYTRDGSSRDCLVTQVVKVNLGGWIGNPGAGARSALSPIILLFGGSFLSRVVRSAVQLREQVERELFVVQPFALGSDGDLDPGHISLVAHSPAARSATFYISRAGRSMFSMGSADSKAAVPKVLEGVVSPPLEADAVPDAAEAEEYSTTGTLDQRFWSCPGAAGFKLRGASYLRDHKKASAAPPVFALQSVDLVETDKPCFHIAQHLPAIRHSSAPFMFVVNIMVPASPPLSLTAAWAASTDPTAPRPPRSTAGSDAGGDGDSDVEVERASPFELALARFVAGGDSPEAVARRNGAFKLIPHIVQGSWIVKQSVGETPVLLGRKLTTQYFRGPNYMEVDIDVSSSSVAKHVVGLVCGATKTVTVDMAILLQGNEADELPESLLGTMRLSQIDLSTASYLDVATSKIHPK